MPAMATQQTDLPIQQQHRTRLPVVRSCFFVASSARSRLRLLFLSSLSGASPLQLTSSAATATELEKSQSGANMSYCRPISSAFRSRIGLMSETQLCSSSPRKPVSLISCRLSTDGGSSVADADLEKVYRIMNSSMSSDDLRKSLRESSIFLSNELMDRVLKRVRFSHGNPLKALELFRHADSRRGFYHTTFSLDTMLYILGRSRKFSVIWDVLFEMKRKDRSVITRRTVMVVLARIAKVCSVRETVESFRKFKKFVPEFDTTCFNGLLRTLCQEKSMTDARNVYHSLKCDFPPNLMTFNILLSGWKSAEEAESFFDEMKDMGVKPDVVSYNSLIDVYCKGREMDKAYKIVEKMKEEDIMPDVITYTSIIGGLGLIGQPDKARDVLKDMKEYGVYPDVPAYNAAIRNFCIAKRLGDAYSLMDDMIGKGLSPNSTTYNLLFRVFYWSNDLESSRRLYQRMINDGCLPNTQSCMFLIRLCRRQEQVDLALKLWNDMVEKGFGSFTLVSDVLFDLLCDMGKLVEVSKCFLQMVEKGQKPSYASFKRIKVLMELANKHEDLRVLSEKMVGVPNFESKVPQAEAV